MHHHHHDVALSDITLAPLNAEPPQPPSAPEHCDNETDVDAAHLIPTSTKLTAKPIYFLFCVSIASIIQSAISNGVFPAIVSSVELIYGLTSTQAGFILAFYDIVSVIAVISLIARARQANRPQWIAIGEAALAVGCIFAIIPAYIARTTMALGLFLGAQTALALAGAPLYPLATTFIYDNIAKKHTSTYLGIFNAMTAVGLAIGFIVAGGFLRADSEYWPYPFVVFGMLAIIIAPFIHVIPASLVIQQIGHYKPTLPFLQACKAILSIPAYTCTQMGFAVEAIIVVGLANFLPKYAQIRFNLDAATASFIVGPLILVAAVIGIIAGGLISRNWMHADYARNVAKAATAALLTTPCFLLSTPQLFMPLFFVLVAVTMLINVPATLFYIRCIKTQDQRALALAIGSSLQRFLGATSGPIAMGAIIDSTCTDWATACLAYDSDALAMRIFIFAAVLKSISTLFFYAAWYHNPIHPTPTITDLHARTAAHRNAQQVTLSDPPVTFDII